MSLCSATLRDDGDCPVRPSVAVTVGVGEDGGVLVRYVILPSYTPLQTQECEMTIQHELPCEPDGRRADDAWYGSLPYWRCPCPSRSGIGLGLRGIGANVASSISF